MRWVRDNDSPLWEGLIIPGLARADARVQLWKARPRAELSRFIRTYWHVEWDLPLSPPISCIVAPTPCAHLFSMNLPGIPGFPLEQAFLGPRNAGDVKALCGKGQTFGVEFWPGGLFPFLGTSLSDLRNDEMPVSSSQWKIPGLPQSPWTLENLNEWLTRFEQSACEQLNQLSSNHFAILTRAIAELLEASNSPPEELSLRLGISARTLQRIFETEIGISLRDTARIIRFNRAIRKIAKRDAETIARIGLECGFFDQAHLNKEFRALAQRAPTEFAVYF